MLRIYKLNFGQRMKLLKAAKESYIKEKINLIFKIPPKVAPQNTSSEGEVISKVIDKPQESVQQEAVQPPTILDRALAHIREQINNKGL